MLTRFFPSKPDHPLADARVAKRLFDELPRREPTGALDEATALLESIVAVAGFEPNERLTLILQLDEAAGPAARRLCREYVVSARLSRPQEMKLWHLNHDYWQAVAAALDDCLLRHDSGEKGAEAMKPALALLYARRLFAGGQRLKWDQFRYGPIEGAFWATIGHTYLAAVGRKLADTELTLYTAVPGSSSPESEYLKTLVFQASSMDKLLPLEIELAERLIAHFLPRFVFTAAARPDNVYWVDCVRPEPPARLARAPEPSPTLRFFNSIPAVEAIEQMKVRLTRDGILPAEVNFGGQYASEAVLSVLDHLAMCWSPKPPMRKDTRHRVKSRLTVLHGLVELRFQLAGLGDCSACETWVVDDVSVGGMGAKVPLGVNDWVRVGALIGLQPEGGAWLLGLVRRFARDSGSVGSVGIETLSKSPRAITADAGGLKTDGILLDPLVQGDTARVALPAENWEADVSLTFPLDGVQVRLFPEAALVSGRDAVIARYFVQSMN